jgi:dipeptidyl aminopeptidase/acylaminoacyl peptidase
MRLSTAFAATLVAALAPATMLAQAGAAAAPRFDLTVANIMRGPEHVGREAQNVRWSADGQWIYFQWAPAGSAWDAPMRPYRVRAVGATAPEAVADAHMDSVAALLASGPVNRAGTTRAVSALGDLFLVDVRRGSAKRLTETVASETNPQFSADGKQLLFTRDNNAFALTLADGSMRQLTDIRSGPAPRDSSPATTGMRGALERQQRELLAVIRDRQRADSIASAERKASTARRLPSVYLPAGERVVTLSISPSLRVGVIVTLIAPAPSPRVTQVPNFVTASGFSEDISTRTKVGDVTARFRAYRLDVATGALRALHTIAGDSTRTAMQVRMMGWSDDGANALLAGYTPDYKWRYLSTVGDTGGVRVIEALRDSAWVGGPCGGCMGFLRDGRVWYASEASGYTHLYSANVDGSAKQTLTSGTWEVEQASLSPDGATFLLHTSEESPFVRHAYRMPVTGGTRTKLTREHGGHTVVMSPDGTRMADVFSMSNRPPELFVASADGSGAAARTQSTSEAFRAATWIKPAIVKIPASDGVAVPARIYRPQDVGATANGAAVIFVHGAGYLHNVHDYWSSYAREYMFHHLLMSKGYVVLDIDYRASAGYGRDWRTAIYRHMGGRDLQDHVDGSRYLQKEFGINAERIGIYGGSYGGFMTLMALFNAPKEFGAGAALRSVTDWSHYNEGYTGGILNHPQDDTLAFRRSSPIYFAQNLEDPLLMAHGMIDTNVHFQDIVRLTQRFIELGKTGWELAVYPVEDHGFTRPDSWTDEYTRILSLFDRTIGPGGTKAPR